MVRMGSPVRFRRPLLRWWFRLVGSDGWRRDEVRLWPRTAVQASGQSIGVLASLPASSLPSFLELNHTVPTSPSHPALHPNRTIQRAHCGPPDRVEVLQRVGGTCHGRIILTSNPTRKTHWRTISGSADHSRILMQPWSGLVSGRSEGLPSRSSRLGIVEPSPSPAGWRVWSWGIEPAEAQLLGQDLQAEPRGPVQPCPGLRPSGTATLPLARFVPRVAPP